MMAVQCILLDPERGMSTVGIVDVNSDKRCRSLLGCDTVDRTVRYLGDVPYGIIYDDCAGFRQHRTISVLSPSGDRRYAIQGPAIVHALDGQALPRSMSDLELRVIGYPNYSGQVMMRPVPESESHRLATVKDADEWYTEEQK